MAGAVLIVRQIAIDRGVRPVWRWVAIWCFALNPMIILYGASAMSEASMLMCMLWAARYLMRWLDTERTGDLAWAGIALGVGYLTRYEMIPGHRRGGGAGGGRRIRSVGAGHPAQFGRAERADRGLPDRRRRPGLGPHGLDRQRRAVRHRVVAVRQHRSGQDRRGARRHRREHPLAGDRRADVRHAAVRRVRGDRGGGAGRPDQTRACPGAGGDLRQRAGVRRVGALHRRDVRLVPLLPAGDTAGHRGRAGVLDTDRAGHRRTVQGHLDDAHGSGAAVRVRRDRDAGDRPGDVQPGQQWQPAAAARPELPRRPDQVPAGDLSPDDRTRPSAGRLSGPQEAAARVGADGHVHRLTGVGWPPTIPTSSWSPATTTSPPR